VILKKIPPAKSQPSQGPSRVALGKRPLRDIRNTPLIEFRGEDEEVQEVKIPLPDNKNLQDENGTQRRTPGRVSKRSKRGVFKALDLMKLERFRLISIS
jgi:hypothetical protein